jgi:hypothetical protein
LVIKSCGLAFSASSSSIISFSCSQYSHAL